MTPRVWIFAHMRNEAALCGYFLRHYSAFAEKIIVYDDGSTDGTLELLAAHPKVEVTDIDHGGINEEKLLQLAYDSYPIARGQADYCMWVDADEFVQSKRMVECLKWHMAMGHDVIRTVGFNMTGKPLPIDDGISQLTDIYRTGIRAPIYSKPIIFNPNCKISWDRGKHKLITQDVVVSPMMDEYQPDPWRLKLLHYRYLTPEYTSTRNARQLDRLGADRGAGWSCEPNRTGEHSEIWVSRIKHLARDVVDENACYLPGVLDA